MRSFSCISSADEMMSGFGLLTHRLRPEITKTRMSKTPSNTEIDLNGDSMNEIPGKFNLLLCHVSRTACSLPRRFVLPCFHSSTKLVVISPVID